MEKSRSRSEREKFWRDHIEAAKGFSGSEAEYCRLNGLKHSSFGSRKRKFERALKGVSSFVKVSASTRGLKSLPDPEWLARFLREVIGG